MKKQTMTKIISTVLLLMGILLLVIKGISVEYIDAQGFLHENFFLIPIGFMCLLVGGMLLLMCITNNIRMKNR